jgi:hypothetical protein
MLLVWGLSVLAVGSPTSAGEFAAIIGIGFLVVGALRIRRQFRSARSQSASRNEA